MPSDPARNPTSPATLDEPVPSPTASRQRTHGMRRASGRGPKVGRSFWLLSLRVLVEVAVVAAFAYWGIHTGSTAVSKVLLGLAAAVVGFGVWGWIDFHQFGRNAEALRLTEELTISLLAAAAMYGAQQPGLGLAVLVLTFTYHLLVYADGGTLLAVPRGDSARGPTASGL